MKNELNLSDEQINDYNPIIEEAIAETEKQRLLDECKSALVKRAKGYDYEETQKMGRRDKNGEAVLYVKTTTKHVPPSEQAIKMLLDMLDK